MDWASSCASSCVRLAVLPLSAGCGCPPAGYASLTMTPLLLLRNASQCDVHANYNWYKNPTREIPPPPENQHRRSGRERPAVVSTPSCSPELPSEQLEPA